MPVTKKADEADAEDARLVVRAQRGDHDAFAALYRRWFDRVYTYLRLILRDRHQAEDATQQVFLKAFQALPRYEHRASFRAWLFTVVRNHAINELEKLNRVQVEDPGDITRRQERATPPDDGLHTLAWITDADLLLFIERLPLSQRQVLVLRFMLDLSDAQAARILDRSPSEIRVLQTRAVSFLRSRLAAIGRDTPGDPRSRMRRTPRQLVVTRARRWALK